MSRFTVLNSEVPALLLRTFEKFHWLDSVKSELAAAKADGEIGLPLMARLLTRDLDVCYAHSGRPAVVGAFIGSEIMRGLKALTVEEQTDLYRKMQASLQEEEIK